MLIRGVTVLCKTADILATSLERPGADLRRAVANVVRE
jgi:hypothetical protein